MIDSKEVAHKGWYSLGRWKSSGEVAFTIG